MSRPTPDRVVAMFDRIAPHYDAMNTLMTGGLDRIWRRDALDAAALEPGMRVLDVATGTGKLALGAAARVAPDGQVVGLDPSAEMLARARRASRAASTGPRVTWVQAGAEALPFADGTFDAVTIGFGLRNLPDAAAALCELARVAAPGGRVVVLEIAAPAGGPSAVLYRTWFQRMIPRLGAVLGSGDAYRYLPESVRRYPSPPLVAELMAGAGLVDVRWRWLLSRMVTLHVGRRASP
jgi:demethylmenaquinone methyltransferase/2-methoxy-6-polyprenyl-1,4-benzoquinol methylase